MAPFDRLRRIVESMTFPLLEGLMIRSGQFTAFDGQREV